VLDRKIEKDLLPYTEREKVPITAYCPFATGFLFEYSDRGIDTVIKLASKYERTLTQIYLNWLIAKKQVITIPKAVQRRQLEENAYTSGWCMDNKDYIELSDAFLNIEADIH